MLRKKNCKWSHFGHLLNVNSNDNYDIQARINCINLGK